MTIGEQIRHYREKKGMSQDQLAEAVGLSGKQVIYRIEIGKRHPRPGVLEKIAEVLGCDVIHELREKN